MTRRPCPPAARLAVLRASSARRASGALPAALLGSVLAVLAAGCAAPTGPGGGLSPAPVAGPAVPGERLQCDQGITVRVTAEGDTVDLDAGPLGHDTLLRDAGGDGPQQAVYSSTRFRLELGLGPDGRGAELRQAEPPLSLHCERAG